MGKGITKVLSRHVFSPAKSNAELLAWHESRPEPQSIKAGLDILEKERGRRSGGRK
jgi:hypothetical protein